jgi:hypothetical protein
VSKTRVDVVAFQAQPTGDEEIPRTTITIDAPIPHPSRPMPHLQLKDYRSDAQMEDDAAAIANALFDCLPHGTLDRLLVKFLERKVSHFVVRVP